MAKGHTESVVPLFSLDEAPAARSSVRYSPVGCFRQSSGVFLVLAATLVVQLGGATKALLAQRYHVLQIVFLLELTASLTSLAGVLYRHEFKAFTRHFLAEHCVPLVVLVLCGALKNIGWTIALSLLPMGDATAIILLAPTFAAALATLFLGESFGRWNAAALLCSLIGTTFIARPTALFGGGGDAGGLSFGSTERLTGLAIALATAMIYGCFFVVLRRLRNVDSFPVALYISLGSTVIYSIVGALLFIGDVKPVETVDDWLLFLAGGLSSFGFHILLKLAGRFTSAVSCSTLSTFELVWAFLLQLILSQGAVSLFSVIGASLIAVGVLIVSISEHRAVV